MSKDIRSFFNVVSKKTGSNGSTAKPKSSEKTKKNRPIIVDSDEDDIITPTPEKPKKSNKRKVHHISSDSEDEKHKKDVPGSSKNKVEKLKPVDIDEVFGNKAVKQSKVEPLPITENKDKTKRGQKKAKANPEIGIHGDNSFEKTLLELDDDMLEGSVDILDKTIEDAMEEIKETPKSASERQEKTPKKRKQDSSQGNTPKKPKLEHTDSGIDPDQERFEKKRYSAMLYQQYKNRAGPKHHGEKEIPKGKPDCLKDLTFLRTGVLDSLEGEEFNNLVKEHGGRVVQAVSKKVNYLVVGEDPGPSKLEKARSLNIPEINEDTLLDMILEKSGMNPKFSKLPSKMSSESGIVSEEETPPPEYKEKKPKKAPVNDSEKQQQSRKISHLVAELPKAAPPEDSLSWTEKYKPKDLKSIIGQQGDASNMSKLSKWLRNWHRNQQPEVRKKMPRPSPWAKNDDGAYYKAALLSGPPGVGKTTTATLISRELGFDVVEFNASDTRSKRLLREEVAQLMSTTTIAGYASGDKTTTKKRVLLMDEVDGMAGNEDRGGMAELINLIKNSGVPVICMCNDRNHQKMRSLVNYCFDLKFQKPRLEQIRGAMMSICFKENIKITPSALSDVISATGCDIRQTLNHLSMWSAADKNMTAETVEKETKNSKKDTVLGPWEVIRLVFTEAEQKTMSLIDKSRLFFYDYSLGPLFVQENYLNVTPNCPKKEVMKRVALAADAISMGDLIDSKIRGSNNWSLLDSQAMFASVLPGFYMAGNVTARVNFPGWLGKNSSAAKRKRMLGELHAHARISTSGSKMAMKLDYLVPLRNAIITPLKARGADGVHDAVAVMKAYNLLREDLTNLVELCQWKDAKNPFNDIDAKVKTAFTKAYNKNAPLLPFAAGAGVSKKKAAREESGLLDEGGDFGESEEGEDEDDVAEDAMIKVKSKAVRGKKEAAIPSSSKGKEAARGKAKKGRGK